MTAKDDPMAVHFTPDELSAAVDEARRLGRDVMAHAHSPAGIKAALLAGVRSIEHATLIDDSCLEIVRQRNSGQDPRGECWIVPTLFIGEYYSKMEADGSLKAPGKLTSGGNEASAKHYGCLSNVVRSGLADRICLGSDYVGWSVDLNERELEYLVSSIGMTPRQALAAATINAARMLRLESKIGSIEVGKVADLIAVQGDPLSDITVMRKIHRVIHNGKIVA